MITRETVLARVDVETFYRAEGVRFLGVPDAQGLRLVGTEREGRR